MDPFHGLPKPNSDHPAIKELEPEFQEKYDKAKQLLANIKGQRDAIQSMYDWFAKEEDDLIYRYYHQSWKVFIMASLIESADRLFKELAPNDVVLNSDYSEIAAGGIGKQFTDASNANWAAETRPMILAFWNTKFFLAQTLKAADTLDEAPQILPSGWAAVLFLYGLR